MFSSVSVIPHLYGTILIRIQAYRNTFHPKQHSFNHACFLSPCRLLQRISQTGGFQTAGTYSHSSGGCTSEIKAPMDWVSAEGHVISLCFSGACLRALIPLMGTPPPWPSHLPKPHLPAAPVPFLSLCSRLSSCVSSLSSVPRLWLLLKSAALVPRATAPFSPTASTPLTCYHASS